MININMEINEKIKINENRKGEENNMNKIGKEELIQLLMGVNRKTINFGVSKAIEMETLKALLENVGENELFSTLTHLILSLIYQLGMGESDNIQTITNFLSMVDIKKTLEQNNKGGEENA